MHRSSASSPHANSPPPPESSSSRARRERRAPRRRSDPDPHRPFRCNRKEDHAVPDPHPSHSNRGKQWKRCCKTSTGHPTSFTSATPRSPIPRRTKCSSRSVPPASTGAPPTSCAASRTCSGYSASGSVARSSPFPARTSPGRWCRSDPTSPSSKSVTRCSASPTVPSPSTRWPERTSSSTSRPVSPSNRPRSSPSPRPPPCRACAMSATCRRGRRVLIIGASGGVGTYAVQIAKALGAEVTGVCSTAKVDLVRSLGADEVIDYTREDFADGATRFDLILDIGGNSRISRLRRALAPKGTVVIVGGEGGKWTGSRQAAPRRRALSFRVAATRHVRQQGKARGPRRRAPAHRGRSSHSDRRPHVPVGRGTRRACDTSKPDRHAARSRSQSDGPCPFVPAPACPRRARHERYWWSLTVNSGHSIRSLTWASSV